LKRHLSAILAADIVGYSRLMEADEAGTISRQKAHMAETVEPAITEHDGRIVKLMGDGILIEFPSVVSAVSCGVAIQKAVEIREREAPEDRRITYRVGINLGDVFYEDGDVFGDGVNIAARLEEISDPGGICISGTAYDHLKSNIPVSYQPLGEITVKNISQPVRVYKVLLSGEKVASPRRTRRVLMAAIAGIALIGAAALWWAGDMFTPPELEQTSAAVPLSSSEQILPAELASDRPSIAVLPFDNLGGGEEQDYFSDGITEDLITDLSQVSGLFVLARNTVFTYKGRAVNVQQVGRELGVSYILEGSVRRSGNRVRINAQLIDAKTGGHVWADRFDRDMADVFAVQDDVVRRIVDELKITLKTDEEIRLSRTDKVDPQAYDALLRGLERLRRFSLEPNLEARAYFEQALAIEPDFARAIADLAMTYSLEASQQWTADPDKAAKRGLELALKAAELDPEMAQIQFVLTESYRANGRPLDALKHARRAIELDPNYADGYVTLAISLNGTGKGHDGLEALQRGVKLNPLKPFFYVWVEAQSYYVLGNYEKAARLLEDVVAANPHFPLGQKLLAATYVEIGQIEDARWAVEELETISIGLTLAGEEARSHYTDPDIRARYIAALRTAGIR